ncbi:SNAP25 proteinous protein SNAP33 [Trifolium repens]|nr:SNAP25 proteinous protein SNAP33 [Trifolium repens]
MTKGAKFISEGGSSNRPPLFEGDDYYYWKDKHYKKNWKLQQMDSNSFVELPGEKLLGNLGGIFSKTWKPKKTGAIRGPTVFGNDPVRVSANHLEQREKLGLNSAPKGQSKPRKTLSGPTNAFERVERWRERRCFLFNKYYDWALIVEQNIEQFPPEVTKDHWAMHLNYRLSPDTMAKADKNALNRQKQRIPHTLDTRNKEMDGLTIEETCMKSLTRRGTDHMLMMRLDKKNEELQKERHTSSDNEAFVTVFGKEHHGYVRGMGLGPIPSQINGSSCRPSGSTSSSTADAKIAKMQSEIDAN